jgi:hypothetical protein
MYIALTKADIFWNVPELIDKSAIAVMPVTTGIQMPLKFLDSRWRYPGL